MAAKKIGLDPARRGLRVGIELPCGGILRRGPRHRIDLAAGGIEPDVVLADYGQGIILSDVAYPVNGEYLSGTPKSRSDDRPYQRKVGSTRSRRRATVRSIR